MNESFHSKLWQKCLKTKFHGLETVRYVFHMAALEHNIGYVKITLFEDILDVILTKGSAQRQEIIREQASAKPSVARTKRKRDAPASNSEYAAGAHLAAAFSEDRRLGLMRILLRKLNRTQQSTS